MGLGVIAPSLFIKSQKSKADESLFFLIIIIVTAVNRTADIYNSVLSALQWVQFIVLHFYRLIKLNTLNLTF